MKRIFLILAVIGIFLSGSVFAQNNIKLGHINSSLLFQAMPESDSAQKKIEAAAQQYQSTLEELQVEFNKKYEDYTKASNDPSTSDLILRTKEDELQSLQQRIQTFQEQAQQDIQKLRTDLFKPIQDKALKAVTDVAQENNFTYIFDISSGAIVYSAENTTDILPLVKQKLGIK